MQRLAAVLMTGGLIVMLLAVGLGLATDAGAAWVGLALAAVALLTAGMGALVCVRRQPRNPPSALYSDHLVSITDEEIILEKYYFPFGSPKHIRLEDIQRIDAVRPNFLIQWRVWGSSDFVTYFPCDGARPTRDTAFILYKKGGGLHIGFTVEDSGRVKEVLRAKELLASDETAGLEAPVPAPVSAGARGAGGMRRLLRSWPLALMVGLLVLGIAQSVYYHPRLPETVASHFGAGGQADAWMDRNSMTVLSLVVPVLMAGTFLVICAAIAQAMSDVPNRAQAESALKGMLIFGCATLGFVLAIINMAYRANVRGDQNLGQAPWLALIAYLLLVVGVLVGYARAARRPPAAL